jgi:gluconate 2-dehydrogenase gamma chain
MSGKENATSSPEPEALTYFNDFQARTVEAITERIIPADSTNGGATQAGVVYYIDRAISGFSTGLQRVYRLGLRELERFCEWEHATQFVNLTAEQQDQVIRRFLGNEIRGDQTAKNEQDSGTIEGIDVGLLRSMFAVIREHAIEGYFCDPVYGGNRGAVGWRLVGFPGVQWGYTAEQMKPGFDATQIPIKTLADLRRELNNLPDNAQYYIKEGK